jgi:hypothetical protein
LGAAKSKVLSQEKVTAYIRRAISSFKRFHYVAAHPADLIQDFYELGLITEEDQERAIAEVLKEIRSEHYNGPHPPNHIAAEPKCRGAQMLQFTWDCIYLKRRVCFKFAMAGSQADERLVVIGIHSDYNPNYFEKLERKKKFR